LNEPSSTTSAAAAHEFHTRYLAEREQGEYVPLEEYLALFPGHEEEVTYRAFGLAPGRAQRDFLTEHFVWCEASTKPQPIVADVLPRHPSARVVAKE